MASDIINEVKKCFEEISVVRENKHTLLGMNIYTKENMIQVDMAKQLEECIGKFDEDVSTLVTSPATKKWFEVREYSEQLSDKKVELFHLVMANLLFLMNNSRPDLDTAMSFLTKRLSNIGVSDWENFRRILRFFHCNLKENRCFGATNLDKIFT